MYNYKNISSGFMAQGDQFNIEISLKELENDVNIDDIVIAEFTFNNLTKQYPEEVLYDKATKQFLFPIKQRESFNLNGKVRYQARIKFNDNTVRATPIKEFIIDNSISKDVL